MPSLTKAARTRGPAPKAEHLHIRASEPDKQTLAQAAQLKNLSVSQFLLQAALPVAEAIVQEARESQAAELRTLFTLDSVAWKEFTRLLDAPTRDLPAIKKLLETKPVWES